MGFIGLLMRIFLVLLKGAMGSADIVLRLRKSIVRVVANWLRSMGTAVFVFPVMVLRIGLGRVLRSTTTSLK